MVHGVFGALLAEKAHDPPILDLKQMSCGVKSMPGNGAERQSLTNLRVVFWKKKRG